MSTGMSALFWGVITFSLLVVIHEGGHFLAARMFGVKVHEFMIGLPGPALRFRGRKTTYGVTAVLLGGYVRIAGMEPGPEDPRLEHALALVTKEGTVDAAGLAARMELPEEEAAALLMTLEDWGALQAEGDAYRSLHAPSDASDPRVLIDRARSITYRGLSYPKRVTLLVAGVVLNLLTAVIIFTAVLSIWGYSVPSNVVDVTKGTAAQDAGLRSGDKIVAMDDSSISDFEDLVNVVSAHDPGDTVKIRYLRDGDRFSTLATLDEDRSDGTARLGVGARWRQVRPSVGRSLVLSMSYIGMTFKAIAGFFSPATFSESVSNSSSVIGAAVYTAEAARSGPIDYAGVVAILSLSLGSINLFPIPPLDGGKVAIETIERLRRRPLPRKVYLGLSVVGVSLLFALIGYLMYADIARLIAG